MKLSFITVALATLITTVFGQVELSGTPTSVLTEGTTGLPAWPAMVRFVPELTNAERIQRGLKLANPRKLYQKSRGASATIEKRLVGPSAGPPQARIQSTNRAYQFSDCVYSSTSGPTPIGYAITYTSIEDLLNQCAARQDARNSIYGFIVRTGTGTNCYTNVIKDTTAVETCDEQNFALYLAE